jgi:hypothetical protein
MAYCPAGRREGNIVIVRFNERFLIDLGPEQNKACLVCDDDEDELDYVLLVLVETDPARVATTRRNRSNLPRGDRRRRFHPTIRPDLAKTLKQATAVLTFAMVDRGGNGGSVSWIENGSRVRRACVEIRSNQQSKRKQPSKADCLHVAESSTCRRSVCRPLSPMGERCAVPIFILVVQWRCTFRTIASGRRRTHTGVVKVDRSIDGSIAAPSR